MDRTRKRVRALLIPANRRRPCTLITIAESAACLSDAIGARHLEEVHHESAAGRGYRLYGDEQRRTEGYPPNERAAVLAARLGWIDLADKVGLHGDLLVVGAHDPHRDSDVPEAIVRAAIQSGLIGPDPET
jgi:hypothetical protein